MEIARDEFFYPTLTQIKDSFFCSQLNTTFSFFFKRLPEVPEYAETRQNMMTSL